MKSNMQYDTIPYIYFENIEFVINSLYQSVNLLFDWFKNNWVEDTEDKCHVFLNTDETVQLNRKFQGIHWVSY